MLKFALKKERLNFTKGWKTSPEGMLHQEVPVDADTIDLLSSFADGDNLAVDTLLKECDNTPDDADIYM
jgi:hypothetical protein